jgi:hypothetical protein
VPGVTAESRSQVSSAYYQGLKSTGGNDRHLSWEGHLTPPSDGGGSPLIYHPLRYLNQGLHQQRLSVSQVTFGISIELIFT